MSILKFASLIFFLTLLENIECGVRVGSNRQGNVRQRAARVCSNPRVPNGSVVPMFKGRMIKFSCNKDFTRYGDEYAECMNGRWSIRTFPICIKAGCPLIHPVPNNGRIIYLNAKASALLFCEPNFESVGSSYAHCNGSQWDRQIGTCRETDNSPMTFCDFESESICGWQHDSDHDTDFERHCGYNNKTLTIHTGPQADHTTGIPLQGHYMVMYTNSEVSTKRARLLSPLYSFPAARQLCFKFYYLMHGSSVGTLRVYMKPASIEMQDVLVDDMEVEAKSEFIIFHAEGSQGNAWIEGTGPIKKPNESFQIIIEAVSGQTRHSDIAFDDISLLIDDECGGASESDENFTESPNLVTDAPDDDDVESSGDSCVGRCFKDSDFNAQLNRANRSVSCSCSLWCHTQSSCCLDFQDICMGTLNTTTTVSTTPLRVINQSESTTTTNLPRRTTTSSETIKMSTTTLGATTTRRQAQTTRENRPTSTTSSSTTTVVSKVTTLTPTTAKTSTKIATTPTTTSTSTSTSTKSPTTPKVNRAEKSSENDYEEIEDERGVTVPPVPEDAGGAVSTFHETDKMTMLNSETDNGTLFMKITFVGISSFVAFAMISIFIVRIYRASSNPLNYKENNDKPSSRGSTNANGEFSEIRFLTSDETLDFTLATDDDL